MYPNRELKDLARLRAARLHSVARRRQESCDTVRQVTTPLRVLDWALAEWRATQFPVNLVLMPAQQFLPQSDRARLHSVQRILRTSLVVLSMARTLDHLVRPPAPETISE